MKRRLNGKFAPGSSIPAYQVLNAYRKLAGKNFSVSLRPVAPLTGEPGTWACSGK